MALDQILPWDELASHLDQLPAADPDLFLYATEGYWTPAPASNPWTARIGDSHRVWCRVLEQRWSEVAVRSARDAIVGLRLIKSPAEIKRIRRVAGVSAAALRAGLHALEPNLRQREVEAEIVCSWG